MGRVGALSYWVFLWMHKGKAMTMAGGIGWEHIAILGWRLAVALL